MPFATVVSGYTGFVKGFVDALSYPCGWAPTGAGWCWAPTTARPAHWGRSTTSVQVPHLNHEFEVVPRVRAEGCDDFP